MGEFTQYALKTLKGIQYGAAAGPLRLDAGAGRVTRPPARSPGGPRLPPRAGARAPPLQRLAVSPENPAASVSSGSGL